MSTQPRLNVLRKGDPRALGSLREIGSTLPLEYTKWVSRAEVIAQNEGVSTELLALMGPQLQWLAIYQGKSRSFLAKRILDFSSVALFFLSIGVPLFLLIGLLIKLSSKGPVFYKQLRMGLFGKPFWIYKFCTMRENAEEELAAYGAGVGALDKIHLDQRVTKLGRFLRKHKIDELPQFINVLKGEMSLVGPRPLSLDESLSVRSARLQLRLAALPGVTGLWQALSPHPARSSHKLALDAYYAKKQSFFLDLYLLWKTVFVVLKGEFIPQHQNSLPLQESASTDAPKAA